MSRDNSIVRKMVAGFPDWLGPVSVKELRQGLRANKFVIPYVTIQVLAIIAVGIEFMTSTIDQGGSGGGVFSSESSLLIFLLWGAIGVLMPLTAIGALRPELKDDRAVELLLLSNLDRWQIVRGKWIVGCLLSGLMFISLIPYVLTRFLIGGVSIPEIALNLWLIILTNLSVTALAVGVSGFRNLLGRIVLLGIGIGAWSIVMSTGYIMVDSPTPRAIADWLKPLVAILALAAPSFLYIVYGLQLGRAKLRLYENPYDPPASGLVIALIIFTPIIVGIFAAATAMVYMIGSFIACIGLAVVSLYIDRGPGKKEEALRYAQP